MDTMIHLAHRMQYNKTAMKTVTLSDIRDVINTPREMELPITVCLCFIAILFDTTLQNTYQTLCNLRNSINIKITFTRTDTQIAVYLALFLFTYVRPFESDKYYNLTAVSACDYSVFLTLQTLVLLAVQDFIADTNQYTEIFTRLKLITGAGILLVSSIGYPIFISSLLVPNWSVSKLNYVIFDLVYVSLLFTSTCGVLLLLIRKVHADKTSISRTTVEHLPACLEYAVGRLKNEICMCKRFVAVVVVYTLCYLVLSVFILLGEHGGVNILADFSNLVMAVTLFNLNSVHK